MRIQRQDIPLDLTKYKVFLEPNALASLYLEEQTKNVMADMFVQVKPGHIELPPLWTLQEDCLFFVAIKVSFCSSGNTNSYQIARCNSNLTKIINSTTTRTGSDTKT